MVGAQRVPAGLVVDHHELATAAVQPVDPAAHRERLGPGRHDPLDTERLVARVQLIDVPHDPFRSPLASLLALYLVAISVAEPAGRQQPTGGVGRALGHRQPPPSGERVVHARAQAVVCPRWSLARLRPVHVSHAVAPGAVKPSVQPGRRRGEQPARHPLEAKLVHADHCGRLGPRRRVDRSTPTGRVGSASMSDPARSVRPRRSVLAVPGSSPRMLAKAPDLAADEVFLDLEDAVAPDAKTAARANVISALSNGGWTGKTVAVRINDPATRWGYRDVVDLVEAAGAHLDCVLLPKVQRAEQVAWLDYTLGQIEQAIGLPTGRIGIEAQIEDARGVAAADAIAAGSPRLEALVFGPADFMASVNMRSLTVGEQPPGYDVGDAFHYVLMRILVAARAHDLLAIDGPYLAIH